MTYRPIFRNDGERPERRTTPDFSKFKVHDSYHKPVMDNLPPGDPADFFLFDPEEKWTVSRETLYSKSYNTPFLGREMQGRVRHHWLGGVQLF